MDVMGTIQYLLARLTMAAILATGVLAPVAATAAGIIETSIFAVQGVEVDVTGPDAAAAKNQALIDAQVKAFVTLAEKLGNFSLVEAVKSYEPKQVLPYLRSLSIEEESISPGRYKGRLTVRFLPSKIKALYGEFGVKVAAEQGPVFLVLPIWTADGLQVLWEDNPWRQGFSLLRAEQSTVPLLVPLGDAEDRSLLAVTDAINGDKVRLEGIRRRYDADVVVVAFAEAAEGGVRARMQGDSPLGMLNFDKVYISESGTIADSAALAAQRFHTVMVEKFRSGAGRTADTDAEAQAKAERKKRKSLSVSIPFAGPSEWNGLRSRILSTPGVLGLDVASLDGNGAVVSLSYTGTLDEVQSSMQASGLRFSRVGGVWVVTQM
jgi:hypothetical protein